MGEGGIPDWSGNAAGVAQRHREWAESLAARVAELERERDKLIAGCVQEAWRRPARTMMSVDESGVLEHGWEWRYGPHGDFVRNREEAVAAVRRVAGLDARPAGGEGGGA